MKTEKFFPVLFATISLAKIFFIFNSNSGSALSHLPFVIVMEALSTEFRVALPWELLYADDLVVIAETKDDSIKRLNDWKDNVENRHEK